MKKLLIIMYLIYLALFAIGIATITKAEEVDSNAVDSSAVVEEEITIDEFKAGVEEYLSQYLEESWVVKIVTWLIDAGVLSALFVIYLKYSKYKHTTIEQLFNKFKEEAGKWLENAKDDLEDSKLQEVKNALNDIIITNENIMKALVLMQDKSSEGKLALIDFLGSKTKEEKVLKEVKHTIEEEQNEKEKINDLVKDDYKGMF